MADFNRFLPIVLKFEGGYCNDCEDPGGETCKGITMAVFRQCSQKLLGVPPTSTHLKSLSDTQAGIIYKALYWDKIQGDRIAEQELANLVCDFYVNAGSNATKLLQKVLNGMGAKVEEDGVMGEATMQALAQLPAAKVHSAYKQGRIAYYRALGKKFPRFLQGWLNRVNSFPDLYAKTDDPVKGTTPVPVHLADHHQLEVVKKT